MTQRKVKTTTKVTRKVIRGRGDYHPDTLALKDPIQRLESKLDHIEKSINKKSITKSDAASTIGRTLGNFVNQGDLGALAGSQLAKFFGHGDYHLHGNSLLGGDLTKMSSAKFSKDGIRGTRITEREYIGDIVAGALVAGSTTFTSSSFELNPTTPTTFPWLSRIANLYDQWEPHGIVFEFVSTSSEYNGSSQALGTVIMATDYDPYDSNFANKQQMENSDYACSSKPAEGLLHGIECAVTERPTRILYTDTANGAPRTSYSLGRFQVATQGMSVANVNLGELWISYDITFYKKQLVSSTSSSIPFYKAVGSAPTSGPFIASPTGVLNLDITVDQVVGTGSRINFNNTDIGTKYEVAYYLLNANATDSTSVATFTLSGCVYDSGRQVFDTAGNLLQVSIFRTTSPTASLIFGSTKSGSSGGYAIAVTLTNPLLTL